MSAAVAFTMRQVAEALKRYSYRFNDEAALHRGIAEVLRQGDIEFQHEHVAGADRFDFLLAGGIVIEAKIKGTMAEALRQIDRYLSRDDVAGVILVTTTLWGRTPAQKPTMRGKPVLFALIGRQSF